MSGKVATMREQGALPVGVKPSVWTVLRAQRKANLAALVFVVAAFWIAGPLGEWRLGGCIAAGVALGWANHIATELWLGRLIASGEQPTRNKLMVSTIVRLAVVAIVGVGIAAAFWPDGVGLLLGLALYRLIALVMTGLPLLKELKQQ